MSKVPTRLIAITFLKASRSCADSIWPSRPMVRWAQPMPAELTTARSGAISAAALTAAVICSVLVTSTSAKTPPISSARASPLSAWRSATTTVAPFAASWRATAAPMPEAAPVTMAVDPLMSMARSIERLTTEYASGCPAYAVAATVKACARSRTARVPLHSPGSASSAPSRCAGSAAWPPAATTSRQATSPTATTSRWRPSVASPSRPCWRSASSSSPRSAHPGGCCSSRRRPRPTTWCWPSRRSSTHSPLP